MIALSYSRIPCKIYFQADFSFHIQGKVFQAYGRMKYKTWHFQVMCCRILGTSYAPHK
jgi:hypothetical protein